jgi:hypothetical protein
MQVKKEFWKMLLLLSSATRCNRAGAGGNMKFTMLRGIYNSFFYDSVIP